MGPTTAPCMCTIPLFSALLLLYFPAPIESVISCLSSHSCTLFFFTSLSRAILFCNRDSVSPHCTLGFVSIINPWSIAICTLYYLEKSINLKIVIQCTSIQVHWVLYSILLWEILRNGSCTCYLFCYLKRANNLISVKWIYSFLFSVGGANGKSRIFCVLQTKRWWIYLFYIAWNFSPSSSIFPR